MNPITIHISIGGRTYPATVNAGHEEYVRKASKQINGQLKTFAARFPSTDVQDQLALAALDNLSRQLAKDEEWSQSEEHLSALADEMHGIISSH